MGTILDNDKTVKKYFEDLKHPSLQGFAIKSFKTEKNLETLSLKAG